MMRENEERIERGEKKTEDKRSMQENRMCRSLAN